jgi:hypothetical protein
MFRESTTQFPILKFLREWTLVKTSFAIDFTIDHVVGRLQRIKLIFFVNVFEKNNPNGIVLPDIAMKEIDWWIRDEDLRLFEWVVGKGLLQYDSSDFAGMISSKIFTNGVLVLMNEIVKEFRDGDAEWTFALSQLVDLD